MKIKERMEVRKPEVKDEINCMRLKYAFLLDVAKLIAQKT